MNDLHQKQTVQRLSAVIIAFFVLAGLSALVVYIADPTIYAKVLMFESTTVDRYPLPATFFLIALLILITVLIVGVLRHWRWLFWLLLLANSFSILEVPATILQLNGVIPNPYPVWYSLYRMSIAVIQVGIAIWMVRILYQYGVWGMGKKKHEALPSNSET
jgi:hypothetical protein